MFTNKDKVSPERAQHYAGQACAYSDPLPCESCKFCLDPIGEFSRARACLCEAYPDMEHTKPSGVLFNNEECPKYEEKGEDDEDDKDD